MTKFILVIMFVLGLRAIAAADAATDSVLVTGQVAKSDMLYFFDSISYDHGKWRFELSRNAMGMFWRTIDGKDDVTGVCNYKQSLVVPKSSTLELKTHDFAIHFQPTDLVPPDDGRAAFIVSKRFGGNSNFSVGGNTILEIDRTGKWSIATGVD